MKRNELYVLLLTVLTSSTISYGYELILSEIVNNTPNPITFVGKELAYLQRVPTVPPRPMPRVKTESAPLAFPIIIPAHSRKRIEKQVVNNEESEFALEIFFNFKDKNNNLVSIIARSGEIFKFAPLLGWERDGMKFTDPNATYHMSFVFEGKDGIADIKIERARSRRVMRSPKKQGQRRY